MAGRNGMGPQNMGPLTGRGLGVCVDGAGANVPMGRGWCGGGFGRGRGGRGFGRAQRNRFGASGQSGWQQAMAPVADEPELLQRQIDALQQRLNAARAVQGGEQQNEAEQ